MFAVTQAYLKINTEAGADKIKKLGHQREEKTRKQLHLPLGFSNDRVFVEDPIPSLL